MKIILKIKRFNPESDDNSYVQKYTVEADPNDRLLDALMHVKRFQDGTLVFSRATRSDRGPVGILQEISGGQALSYQ